MQYKIYCLLKSEAEKDKVLRVRVIADCISDALNKAKEMFARKLRSKTYHIFMYETAK